MTKTPNVLWIMADQLRWDHLSCYGHPNLRTPAMDAIAARGVRFDRAYVNATVCGPSRMCYYTGRTMSSHGSNWNGVPLRVGRRTGTGPCRQTRAVPSARRITRRPRAPASPAPHGIQLRSTDSACPQARGAGLRSGQPAAANREL